MWRRRSGRSEVARKIVNSGPLESRNCRAFQWSAFMHGYGVRSCSGSSVPMTPTPSSPSPQSACAQSSARTPCRLCSGEAVPMSFEGASIGWRLFLLAHIPFRARRATPPVACCSARRTAGLLAGLCRVRRGRACGSLLRRRGELRSQASALLSSCPSRLRPP